MGKQQTSFLLFRAFLAILLMIGFYLLALGIAGLLAYLPIAEVIYAHRIHPKLALICLVSAGIILWSILPRFDKFVPPGPKLEPSEHPKFFKRLKEIADRTGQAMPAEVYLCPEVNAWVTQRGGIMGFGSRRVMGVGLPLLQVFTVSEFSAVLAHEFGHYHGGDTKLGPWIYKTRGMIGRTLYGLGDSWIQKPFLAYGKLFLRITHAISRRQEYLADELAARAVSSQALISGLKKVHGAALGYNGFLQNEFGPVVNSGMRAAFVDGFSRYLNSRTVKELIAKNTDQELKEGKGDPYDTHPALKDRVAALEQLACSSEANDDTPAINLIENFQRYEPELLKCLTGDEKVAEFNLVHWEEVGIKVYLPGWKKVTEPHKSLLEGKTVEELYACASDPAAFVNKLGSDYAGVDSIEDKRAITANVVGAALALNLVNSGWCVEAELGEKIRLRKGGATMEPFDLVVEATGGKVTEAQWREKVQAVQ